MFLPAMSPRDIAGQSLQLKAQYLGAGVVSHLGAPIAGLLFRDGMKIFILHSEGVDGTSRLLVSEIEESVATTIQDYRETIAGLLERINDDRTVINDLRTQAQIDKTAIAMLREASAEQGETRISMRREIEGLTEFNLRVSKQNEELADQVSRYVEAVGPLEPAPVDNSPVLDFGEESAPIPPPVVSPEDLGTVLSRDWSETNKPPVDSDLL